jgi:hypothetical protein
MQFKTKKRGRPSKYKQQYCQSLIDHMSDGLSYESFAGLIGVCVDSLYDWEVAHPEFFDAKTIGQAKRLLYNELIIDGLAKGKVVGSTTAQIFRMKNLGGNLAWKDKTESVITADVNSDITLIPKFGDE